jgi:hypothetical protein
MAQREALEPLEPQVMMEQQEQRVSAQAVQLELQARKAQLA